MRLKEWFSWHFPELARIITDNAIYTKIVNLINKRENVVEEIKEQLVEICKDEDAADQIIEAAKTSMGQELTEMDEL